MRELRQRWRNTKLAANSLWRTHRGSTPFPVDFDQGLSPLLDDMQSPNVRNRRQIALQVVDVTTTYRGRVRAAQFPVPEIASTLLVELDHIDNQANP